VVDGAELADGLGFRSAIHAAEPTVITPCRQKKGHPKEMGRVLHVPDGAGAEGGTGEDLCGRGRHIGAPVFASEGTSQCLVFG
jgi:hypothetical protein